MLFFVYIIDSESLLAQQLLCLVLQVVATLALDPTQHRSLVEANVPDALTQLILPSDEWYYTNHSTRHARYVKHHAARVLVYLGLQHRVNHRVNLYDLLLGEAQVQVSVRTQRLT